MSGPDATDAIMRGWMLERLGGDMSEPFWPNNMQADEDPMRLVREARERGVEPKLVTGYDPGPPSALVIAWHIPDTNTLVWEGVRFTGPGEQEGP